MEKIGLHIQDLKIQSFVTSLQVDEEDQQLGGMSQTLAAACCPSGTLAAACCPSGTLAAACCPSATLAAACCP